MSFILLLLTILALALFALGVYLIIASRRVRFDHPACGGCGYDMTRSITAGRCPECGADIAVAGIVPPGRSKHSGIMLTGGVVIIVVVLGCIGTMTLSTIAGFRAANAARARAVQQRNQVQQQALQPQQPPSDAPAGDSTTSPALKTPRSGAR